MSDLIKDVFAKDEQPVRRLALALVLIAIALFAIWKSLPDRVRGDLLQPFMANYAARHASSAAKAANDSANALEARLPAIVDGIQVQYFSKAADAKLSDSLIARLQQHGLQVVVATARRNERSNAVWCGSHVSAGECVLVALRMIQSGFSVTQVFRYPPNRDRPNLIQIGYNDNLGRVESYVPARLMALVRSGIAADLTPP